MFNEFRSSESLCVELQDIADCLLLFLYYFNELCKTELFCAAYLIEGWRMKPNNPVLTLGHFLLS